MDPRLVLPIVMGDAEKIGKDIQIQVHPNGDGSWVVVGSIDSWPVVGFVNIAEGGFDHGLWFANAIH